ncbi:MAG: TGS domain-containing protein [Patescibacteria group bacterium]
MFFGKSVLKSKNVRALKVEGRMKHTWSIFQKMQKKGTENLEDIYDLFAVRVILPAQFSENGEEISHLYSTLGLIHSAYIPMQDRFKDYLAVPKPNGYRSLHSTVLGLGGEQQEQAVEIQLRSERMHEEAEIGVASHTSYKTGKARKIDLAKSQALEEAMTVVQEVLQKNPDISEDVKQWIENYQLMTIEDRKKGEALLSEHGISEEHLKAIRKGRSMGMLSMQPTLEKQLAWLRDLASKAEGDPQLELFADKIFVLTPARDILELTRGATALDFAYAVHTDVGHRCVLAKVNGRVVPLDYELHNGEQVEIMTRSNSEPKTSWISLVKTSEAKNKIKAWFNKKNINLDTKAIPVAPTLNSELPVPEKKVTPFKKGENKGRILVTGEEDLPVIFSACCKPAAPAPVIGYVTRGKSIRIHRQNCRELQGLEGQRFVSAHWEV